MQMTVRNAKKLAKELEKVNDDIVIRTATLVSEADEDIVAIMQDDRQEADLELARKLKNIETIYAIRKLVGQAQAEARIHDKLTEAAEAEAKAELLENVFAYAIEARNPAVLNKVFEKSRNAADNFETKEATTGLYMKEDLEVKTSEVQKLRRKAAKLKDDVLAANFTTSVSLPEEVVKVLEAEGIDL